MKSSHNDSVYQLDMFGDMLYIDIDDENIDKFTPLEEVFDGNKNGDFELERASVQGGGSSSEPAGLGGLGGSGRPALEALSSEILQGTSGKRDVGRSLETDGRRVPGEINQDGGHGDAPPRDNGDIGAPINLPDTGTGSGGGRGHGIRAPGTLRNAHTDDRNNYHIFSRENASDIMEGGVFTKCDNNLAAIRLLKSLDSASLRASPNEQAVLVKYTGWGGIPQVFDNTKPDWASRYQELHELFCHCRRSSKIWFWVFHRMSI